MEEEQSKEVVEADNDKLCVTSRKDSNSRCSSLSKSVKSARQSMRSGSNGSGDKGNRRGPIMPEPLPLYDGEAIDEPSGTGIRRPTKLLANQPGSFGLGYCPHEEVYDWVCKECKKRVSQFDTIFDDYQGRVSKFLKVCYENQFLQDFLTEQINQLEMVATKQVSDDDESSDYEGEIQEEVGELPTNKNKREEKRNPDIIYQCYQPINATELREYMLFCMSTDLQAFHQMQQQQQDNLKGEEILNNNREAKHETATENSHTFENERNDTESVDQVKIDESIPATTSIDKGACIDVIKEEPHQLTVEEKLKLIKETNWIPHQLNDRLGTGKMQNLSMRLTRFLNEYEERQEQLMKKHNGDVILFDTIFESGNLLRADRITRGEYRLYMQVDTNTKGHQQWFYFRARNTRKDRKFVFKIMNFTKPGVTGGSGYRKNELFQRIMYKSKLSGREDWSSIGPDKLEFVRTKVQRRKKDALAAGADSDQEDWVEEAFGLDPNLANGMQASNDEEQDYNRMASNTEVPSPLVNLRSGLSKDIVNSLKKKRKFFYYSLVFEVRFEHDDDTVFFAFSQPYTYSQTMSEVLEKEEQLRPDAPTDVQAVPRKVIGQNLNPPPKPDNPPLERQNTNPQANHPVTKQSTLQNLNQPPQINHQNTLQAQRPGKDKQNNQNEITSAPATSEKKPTPGIQFENYSKCIYYQRRELCRSVMGIPLWQITISRSKQGCMRKPTIVITSRVHSGETPASIVFKGIFDFLTSDRKEAKFLRKFYTFVLIPVLNPDGVICGNYRNSIAGLDLNRQWINPDQEFQPEIFYTKQMFKNFTDLERRQIWIYCDIHGHSKKKNSFFYGCNTAANGGFLSWTIVRILPRIFAQKTHLFNYRDCRFKVEPYKIGTGRVVAWKQFQITHSFTLENSFYGFDFGEEESKEFSEEEYQGVGNKFIESIYELHFIWKQIKRELQITNGWLKPKVLFEKTGVPAAQLLNEEIEKKKKDEKKKQAIEQYQQFLKKYYNQGRGAVINPLPQSQLVVKTKNEKGPVMQAQPPSTGSSQSSMSQNNFAFGSNKNQRGPRNQSDDTETTKSRNPNSKIISTSESNQRLANFSTKTENVRPNSSQHQMKNQTKLAQGDALNADLEFQDEDDMQEDIMKSLYGLVKVQARIRGIIARRRVKKLMEERKKNGGNLIPKDFKFNHGLDLQSIQKHTTSNSVLQSISQRSNKLIRSSSFHEKHRKQTNSDHSVDGDCLENVKVPNQMHSSKDTLSRGSNFEHLSTRRMELINRDWRHYFQETELDNAFQKVEIECRDISEEGSSAASTSNPSDDNLEPEEMYNKVYSISAEKATKIFEKKKEQTKKLIQQMTNPESVSGPQLFDKIQGKGDHDNKVGNGRAIQSGNPSRRGTLKFYRAFNQKTNSSVAMQNMQNVGSVQGYNIGGTQAQDRTMDNDLNMNNNKQTSPYFQLVDANNQQLGAGLTSQQILNQRASNTHSPMNALDQYAVNDYNLSSANIAFQQVHGRGLMLSKDQLARQRINQQRATTSHGSGGGSSMINSSLITHGFQQSNQSSVHPTNISQQMRNMHLNYKGGYGKKENINQVIKDCFITKKCEVRKPQDQSQANGPQSKSVNSGYQGTFKSNSNANTKKGRKIKRVKSPMNAMEHPNQFYRSVGAMNNTHNTSSKQHSQKAVQRNYYGAAAMLKDIKDRNTNFVYLEKNSLEGGLQFNNMTQNLRHGPNINNMYALEDLDERDPAGLRAIKNHQSAKPNNQKTQAFFERTQQPGIRSSSNQPQISKIQMNANPAYYQVMYNEMVQKTTHNLSNTTSGNIYGSDSRQFQINANMMRSRKALGKTNTQSVSGQNQIMNFRMHQQQHHQRKEQQEQLQTQATVFNDFIQDQNLFEAVPDSAIASMTQQAMPHTYPVSLKKYGSTGDQDEFSLRDVNFDNTNMFIDKNGRQMRLPDISHLSASGDMPDAFQAQIQNFQLDPYALHQKQPQNSALQKNNPVHLELGLSKAQYYSQSMAKNAPTNQIRDKNSNLAIRTNDSNANLVDDAEIIKYQNQTSPKIKNSGPQQINLQSGQLSKAFSHRKQPFIQRAHATPVMNDRQPVHQPGQGVRQVTSHGNMLHNSLDNKQVNMIQNGVNMAPSVTRQKQIPLAEPKPRSTPGMTGSHKAALIQQQTVFTGPEQVGNGLGDHLAIGGGTFASHPQPKVGAGHSAKVAHINRDSPGMMSNQVQNKKATHSQNRVHSQRLGENPVYDPATVSNLKIEGQHGASQKRYVRKYITKHE